MYSLFAVSPGTGMVQIDRRETVAELVSDMLEYWHEEDPTGSCFLIRDEPGRVVCTVMCGLRPEIALVTFQNGVQDAYNVVYNLDGEGRYLSTTVQKVAKQP